MADPIPGAAGVFAECPVWLPGPQRLCWLDCAAGRLLSFDWRTHAVEHVFSRPGVLFSGLVRYREDALLLITGAGMVIVDFHGGATPVSASSILDIGLVNDAKADRAGHLWLGQVRSAPGLADGGLFRLKGAEAFSVVSGLGIPNGPAFGLDGETVYFADSLAGTVESLAVDPLGDDIRGRRRLVALPPEIGQPDGMTVDAADHLIVAVFAGGMLLRIDPESSAVERIPLPVRRPTSCAFGGPDLRTLFVTVANGAWPQDRRRPGLPPPVDPGLASLYAVTMSTPGVPELNIAERAQAASETEFRG